MELFINSVVFLIYINILHFIEGVPASFSRQEADIKLSKIVGGNNSNPVLRDIGEYEFPEGFRGLMPFTISGNCQKGWRYRITRGEDLLKRPDELECIFFSGISPSRIPLGPLHGTVISILNVDLFSSVINEVWWGKLLTEIPCKDDRTGARQSEYIGWNNLLDHLAVPFIAKIGPIEENLPPGEFNDGKLNFIIDYSKDFARLCDEQHQTGVVDYDAQEEEPVTNVYPINRILDALRLVGVQEDGGRIYLGKTFLRDPFGWSSTVLYFYFVNYDLSVNPEFRRKAALPPLGASFEFTIPGVDHWLF